MGVETMVKRRSHETTDCPIARSLDAIGDWWSLLIVRDALKGQRRFGEFQKSTGAAKNILAVRLQNLVAHGVMRMEPAADGAHQEYVLTDKGFDLFPLLVAFAQWGETHFFEPGEPRIEILDRETQQKLPRLEVRAADGRRMSVKDAALQVPGDER